MLNKQNDKIMIKFVHQTMKIKLCRFNLQHVPYVFLSSPWIKHEKVSLKFVMFYKLRLYGPKFYFMSIIINIHFQLTLLCYDFSLDAMCLINWFVSFSNFFTSCACSVLYWRHCEEENISLHVKSIWIREMWLIILVYSNNKLLLWIENHNFHNKTIF